MRRELWWQTKAESQTLDDYTDFVILRSLPKEITPMAWKMPPLMVRVGRSKPPRSSEGTINP